MNLRVSMDGGVLKQRQPHKMCLGVTMNGEVLEKKKQSHEICLGVLRKINERISQRRGNS